MSITREGALEKKVINLEKRLTLMERFVELRFCETFRDFSIRNSDDRNQEDDKRKRTRSASRSADREPSGSPKLTDTSTTSSRNMTSTSSRNVQTRSTSNSRTKTVNKRNSDVDKLCTIRVVKASTPEIESATRRYNTRTSNKRKDDTTGPQISRNEIPVRKLLLKEEIDRNTDEDDDEDGFNSSGLHLGAEPEDGNDIEDAGGQEYFTFPSGPESVAGSYSGNGEDDRDPIGSGSGDESWTGATQEQSDEESESQETASDQNIPKKRKITTRKARPTSNRKRTRVYPAARLENLSADMKVISSDQTRTECSICHRHFKHEFLELHLKSHTSERHLKCKFCDKTFYSTNGLKNHQITHQKEKFSKNCRHCSKSFLITKILAHERYCVKRAFERNEAVDPELIEDLKKRSQVDFILPDKDYDPSIRKKCPHCTKSFKLSIYEKHVKIHTTERNWKCSLCPKTYYGKHELVRHMHNQHENSHTCEICEITFDTRQALYLHKSKCAKEKTTNSPDKRKRQSDKNDKMAKTVSETSTKNSQDAEEIEKPTTTNTSDDCKRSRTSEIDKEVDAGDEDSPNQEPIVQSADETQK